MKEELDFEDYPTLHLHLMIDDYEELCREKRQYAYLEREQERSREREHSHYAIDPQGRFSFCFTD